MSQSATANRMLAQQLPGVLAFAALSCRANLFEYKLQLTSPFLTNYTALPSGAVDIPCFYSTVICARHRCGARRCSSAWTAA
jgi:hypothetical protein